MAQLFTANFENDDWSDWDTTTAGGNGFIVLAAAALNSTNFGVKYLSAGAEQNEAKSADLGTFSSIQEIRLVARIDPQSATFAYFVGSPVFFELLYLDNDGTKICSLSVTDNGDGTGDIYAIGVLYEDDTSGNIVGTFATTPISTDTKIEVRITRSSSAVASNATAKIYLDDVLKHTITGKDNFDRWPTSGTVKAVLDPFGSDGATFYYMDEITINTVGPYDYRHSSTGIPGSLI
jgi:hypothetical protein